MDTTLPLPFLPSVDLAKGPVESKEGLSRQQLSLLGSVYCTATIETIDNVLQFLQSHVSLEAYVNVTSIDSKDDIVTILDAGARKVFVSAGQFESLQTYGDRVIPLLDEAKTATYTNGVLVNITSDEHTAKAALDRLAAGKTSPIFLASSTPDLESFSSLATEYAAIPIISADSLTFEAGSQGKKSVPELIAAAWTTDRADKLIPTVVTDERGFALGLVYSSQESLTESLKTGTGVYQSRKRGLWHKGATSGDVQELVRISLDCDQDALKFVVSQKGRGKKLQTLLLF